jgi:UDP-N-acetyl-D-glucosamine dehydrogenase
MYIRFSTKEVFSMYNELKNKLTNHDAKIGIIGLGYVGLPLAVELAKSGFKVTGFEVDAKKVKSISAGISYILDVDTDAVRTLRDQNKLKATTDFKYLKQMDAVIICVPTPLRKSKDPDVSYIVSATEKIVKNLRPGQLIILESTTYPGTTKELVLTMLEATGMKHGKDFFLAFSPERVDPGNPACTKDNEQQECYLGDPNTLNVGACHYGKRMCKDSGIEWGP